MTKTEYEEIVPVLLKDGYEPVPPIAGNAARIDYEICKDGDCESCGCKGTSYRPFTKEGHYRSFSVCPNCGDAFEF